jgi:hypothetical protein
MLAVRESLLGAHPPNMMGMGAKAVDNEAWREISTQSHLIKDSQTRRLTLTS